MNQLWGRPSALSLPNYDQISAHVLMKHYERDNEKAANLTIPARPASALRVCQWNVQFFQSASVLSYSCNEVFKELMRHDVDVIVLNEVCTRKPTAEIEQFFGHLYKAGYRHQKVSDISYPTAVFTRQDVERTNDFALDADRSAVSMCLKLTNTNGNAPTRKVWIYGTHLHHIEEYPGKRKQEMQVLLNHAKQHPDKDAILVVGDFNQQRPQDYSPEEWNQICANKKYRKESSITDGVARLLASNGFACAWDNAPARNWPLHGHPPATHWSGTVIDYAYSRNIKNVGAYVSPAGWSDHRLIVTDWKI